MDELFLAQRRGYDIALDKLIREAEPKDRMVRCDASLRVEERTEVEYRNTMLLKAIYDRGLGDFREPILAEGNAGLDRFGWDLSSMGHYDRQKVLREREDAVLAHFLHVIDGYSDRSTGESVRNRGVEIRYLKNMVQRQIHSRGLRGDVMIPAALDRELNSRGLDVSYDYDRIMEFSLDFVNRKGNKLDGARRNLYLLENEHHSEIEAPFPALAVEELKSQGIVNGLVKHAFLYFPVTDGDNGYTYASSIWKLDCGRSAGSQSNQEDAARYLGDEFSGPRIAITTTDRSRYIKDLFEDNGCHIMTFS